MDSHPPLTQTTPATSLPSARPVTIFIAAKQNYGVEGLRRILSDNSENNVVACVEPSEHCWTKLHSLQPDVLLLHHQAVMPMKREQFARIAETAPGASIIIFGQDMDDGFLMDCIRAGASGYLNEGMTGQDIFNAIREVKSGRLYMERRFLDRFARDAIQFEITVEKAIIERLSSLHMILSRRETTVFLLLLEGMTTKQIAEHLCRSEQSIKMHLGRIFVKFNVTSRSQLIASAFSKICPVQNFVRLVRSAYANQRLEQQPIHEIGEA